MKAIVNPRSQRSSKLKVWLISGGLSLLILSGFALIASYKLANPRRLTWVLPPNIQHLGAEYNAIARAIRDGRGFSDPFHDVTGPTAWMPPVLPYFQAALYRIGNGRDELLVIVIMGLNCLAAWLTGSIIIAQSRNLGIPWFGCVAMVVGMMAHFNELMLKSHDSGLLLLMMNMLYLGIVKCWEGLEWPKACVWGLFGGFSALCSPIVGAVWAVLTCWRLWPRASRSRDFKRWYPIVSASLVSVLVVTPWTLRNRVVLDKWVPIKSNGMYELWQSQCNDGDGLLDPIALGQHPIGSTGDQRTRYEEVGEIRFIAEKGDQVKQAIFADPWSYLERIAHRFAAANIYYFPYFELKSAWPIWLKRLVFPLPLLAMMLLLWKAKVPMPSECAAAISIYVLYLLPYVLISYYERYATPLAGVKLVLVIYAFSLVKGWFARKTFDDSVSTSQSKRHPIDPLRQ